MVSNTAYGTVGRRFNHGVAALPNNGEVILTRAEGGRKGNKLGKVPHQRVVLQGRAGIGDRRCSGGILAAQARLDGACNWEISCAWGWRRGRRARRRSWTRGRAAASVRSGGGAAECRVHGNAEALLRC